MDAPAARITLFLAVRNVPYATDGAHDAETLMTLDEVGGSGQAVAAHVRASGFTQSGNS
ncbi:hypothetical protein [Nonomuraea sp. JJY05]|uniref:hypothetical protein n=1 Tax=Nonomuraea sp. JJY05 TaxID=3350255 RepID=UPI00373E5191